MDHLVWVLLAEIPTDEDHLEQERAWTQLTHLGGSERAAELLAGRDAYLDALVRGCLERLGTEEATREHDAVHLRALLDGLTAAACRADVTPEQATECLAAHLRGLLPRPSPDATGEPAKGEVSPDAA